MEIIRHFPKISLTDERQLIAKAQNGSRKCRDEIVLRHIGFLVFRIKSVVFPHLLPRFKEDLLGEVILILCGKIKDYDLN